MKSDVRKNMVGLLVSLALLGISGCTASTTTARPTATTEVSRSDVAHLSESLSLTEKTISETGASPIYTLKALVPFLAGSEDPRVLTFNEEIASLVQLEIDDFKQSITNASNPPVANGSSFDLQYSLSSPWGDILSIKFVIDIYFDGAAHPGQTSKTFNYDLEIGQQINLDQLFLPGTDYLQVLANYCRADLGGRNIGFDASQTGADPVPDNYRNWNISSDGLVITFDTYQVAAGAAGPQIVTIPYTDLQAIIDPNGPLTNFIH
jgi:hypothetical protein